MPANSPSGFLDELVDDCRHVRAPRPAITDRNKGSNRPAPVCLGLEAGEFRPSCPSYFSRSFDRDRFSDAYFAGRFDRRSASVSGVEKLALYVVFAIPLDWLALQVCRSLGIDLDYDTIASLLSGSLTPDGARQVASATPPTPT